MESGVLPPTNRNALRSHLTDLEWKALLRALKAEPAIGQARVYGSRQSGVRRPKDKAEPLDIDLAIAVLADDSDDAYTVFFAVAGRLKERVAALNVQVEDLTDAKSQWFEDRQAGVIVFDRAGT